jgi:hypothetical protein
MRQVRFIFLNITKYLDGRAKYMYISGWIEKQIEILRDFHDDNGSPGYANAI